MNFNEFEIIDRYFSPLSAGGSKGVVLGGGDDCAVLTVPEGFELCVSTDTLVAGVHFPAEVPPEVVAHRSLAANASDLAAMGANPVGYMLALTLVDADHNWLQAFSDRLGILARRWQMPLLGGNLTKARELSLTVTVMGTTPSGGALRRSGAQSGDDIYVTGFPGEAGAGLASLQRDPDASGTLVNRYYYPEPRLAVGRALRDIATAAIDVSDGLAADLGHLVTASGVTASVDVPAIPLSPALIDFAGQHRGRELALSAGDDYELCFTAPAEFRTQITESAERCGVQITRIGCIQAGSGEPTFLDEAGEPVLAVPAGYRHF